MLRKSEIYYKAGELNCCELIKIDTKQLEASRNLPGWDVLKGFVDHREQLLQLDKLVDLQAGLNWEKFLCDTILMRKRFIAKEKSARGKPVELYGRFFLGGFKGETSARNGGFKYLYGWRL